MDDLIETLEALNISATVEAVTALRAAAEREKELTQALGECQKTLAMLTLPEAIQNSSVTNAWAACVAAETRARAALAKHEKPAE